MTIKVSFFSPKVRRQYASVVAVISAVSAFYLIAVEIPVDQRGRYLIAATVALIGVYLTVWLKANFKRHAKLNINSSSVIVRVGDIFQEEGLKAIAFNEYFDTIVDDSIISKSSLNGKYLLNLSSDGVASLDNNIANDVRLKERQVEINSTRRTGKKIKYKLGSVFLNEDYLLTAFSHFDSDNRAFLSLKEYVSCMLNFWDEVDQVYAGRSVTVPLMGSGITRFKDAEVQPQELLKVLIWTFKISRVKFKHPANATIIIHNSITEKINLYDLDS